MIIDWFYEGTNVLYTLIQSEIDLKFHIAKHTDCEVRSDTFYEGACSATRVVYRKLFTTWWGYTGGVKLVILSYLSYYSILFGITAHFSHVTPLLCRIIAHFYHVTPHLARIIIPFSSCYSTLLACHSTVRSSYSTLILLISLSSRYCWQLQTQNYSRLDLKCSVVDLQSAPQSLT
jgi:hypothetical protein